MIEIGLINKDRTSILGEKLISLGFEGSNSFFSKKMNGCEIYAFPDPDALCIEVHQDYCQTILLGESFFEFSNPDEFIEALSNLKIITSNVRATTSVAGDVSKVVFNDTDSITQEDCEFDSLFDDDIRDNKEMKISYKIQ